MVNTFRDLKVWQKAHALTLKIYQNTSRFPREETFGLSKQIRSSALSVAANIVEGHSRKSQKDFLHFLNIAKGSLEETKYHLLLSKDLGYISELTFQELSLMGDEVGRLLNGFRKGLLTSIKEKSA